MVLYAQNEQEAGIKACLGSASAEMETDTFKDRLRGASGPSSFTSSSFRLAAPELSVDKRSGEEPTDAAFGGSLQLLACLSNLSFGSSFVHEVAPGVHNLEAFGVALSGSLPCFPSSGEGIEAPDLLKIST